MKLQSLLKSRIPLTLFAGFTYLTWKSLTQYVELDESIGDLGTDAIGLARLRPLAAYNRPVAISARRFQLPTKRSKMARSNRLRNCSPIRYAAAFTNIFDTALSRSKFDPDDVEAGLEAHVSDIHYVERLWRAAQGTVHAHEPHHTVHGH